MKKLFLLTLLMVAALYGSACTRVDAGYVGVKVNMAGSQRGVEDFPNRTGWVFYNPATSEVKEYPTFVQTVIWTHDIGEGHPSNEEITFTTGDQMKVDADISLAYHLDPNKIPAFYVKFRSDDLETFTHGFLRNLAREKFDNVAGKYKIEQIMGDNAQFLKEVRSQLQADLDPIGVKLDQFGIIGAPRPPHIVIDSINAKVKATQDAIRVENELRQSTAEAAKKVAIAEGDAKAAVTRAKGNAEANETLARSLTPNIIEWQRMQIQQQAINRWNGVRPQVEAGSGSGLMIQLSK